jgi:phenylacetic acid degradation operon negative regulatory protein
MGRLGIEAGAVRTALSRLASEGWVIRQRRGRLSHYSLDMRGQRAFDEATQLIYAPGPPEWDGRWSVAVPTAGNGEAGPDLEAAGFVSRGGTWIRPEVRGVKPLPKGLEHYLVIDNQPGIAPVNAHDFWSLDGVARRSQFSRALEPLVEALDHGEEPEPLDALALRTLLIHEWRRIVLRSPALPAALLPPDLAMRRGTGAIEGDLRTARSAQRGLADRSRGCRHCRTRMLSRPGSGRTANLPDRQTSSWS